MSRITFRSPRGPEIVGRLHRASPDNLVIMVHGFTSDKSSRGRFDYASLALKQKGLSTLAFDFAGCGESEDDVLTIARQIEDLRAVAASARSLGFNRFAIWANSLGTRVSLQADLSDVWAMVLTGAGTGSLSYDWNSYFSADQLAELDRSDRISIPLEDGPRAKIVIAREMLAEFCSMDQEAVLSRVSCPVLIVHGDADEEERALAEISRRGLKYLPPESRMEILEGAAHGFIGYLDRIVSMGSEFLIRRLPAAA